MSEIDERLFEVLKECRTLPNFLDSIFGFLYRRTDFYIESTPNNASPVGLPKDCAESLVKDKFFKWKMQHNSSGDTAKPPQLIPKNHQNNLSVTKQSNFTSSDSYNGAVYDNYSWSQTLTDVDINVKIPENVTSKQLQVTIESSHIDVTIKSTNRQLLSGDLCYKIKQTDAIWSIDNNQLLVHLDKVKEIWWDCLVTSESRLDISRIDCSRPFEELSPEAQAKIEQLTWDQERKRKGLPTSEQMEMESKLRKAWNAEGSPFSGEFDPSIVQFN